MAYRTPGEIDITDPLVIDSFKLEWKDVFEYHETYNCPACTSQTRYFRKEKNKEREQTPYFKGCMGKKKFFGGYKCPPMAHLHVDCWSCKLNFLMWSK